MHKVGIFFSHPTQHHSVMFQRLSERPDLRVKVYYYDAGSLGGMYDTGYGNANAWDVDLTSGTDVTMLHNLLRGHSVRVSRQVNPGVVSAMLRERFESVFVSGYASPSNWLVLLTARILGTRVLYQSDTNVLDERRKARSWWKRALSRTYLAGVDRFLAIGDQNRAAYLSHHVPEEAISWCPIPIDTRRYAATLADSQREKRLRVLRHNYDIPEDALVIAWCGKFIERKRPQDAIAAMSHLRDLNVYLLMIGSGALESALQDRADTQSRVRFTGFVNQADIPYHMMLGSVGIVTSEWDPHPLVTTEFAACGLPVIVSHYCGVWGPHDILRPGENGFVYQCGDVQELAAHVRTILGNADLRQRMSDRSRALASEQSAEAAAAALSRVLLESA